ncbi:hypothetical protein D020_3123A, partial [Vibrio parahaemolyticus SBR10290]
MIKFTLLGSF